MSDSEHSTVTYTSVSIPVKDDSDIGLPGVDGLPIMPGVDGPPSPEYIPGPEEPQSPPPLDFVPEPMYPEYVPESDPEEEPEEDDEDPEEDPANYPANMDDDDDNDDDEDEDEEEEHPASADSVPPVHRMITGYLSGMSHPYHFLLGKRTDRPEITLPPRKRLGIDLGPRYEIRGSSAAAATRPIGGCRADYGFVSTMDTEIRRRRAEEYHYETARLLDQEALVSQEAWGHSIEVSYMTRSEILALRSVVMSQHAVISQLQAADRKSQVVTLEMLQADYQRQVQLTKALELLKGLQTQMAEFQRQLGPAKGPAQPDAPGEAGSSS
ncbi:hypothetical protein Tco_1078966 [Tanacetum coccineum]|uniref:Uncharacterized protein n=1 Tax=Tanacetum coccineum TaxID=301880 RepID=A0ABQ5HQH6_9ASTR